MVVRHDKTCPSPDSPLLRRLIALEILVKKLIRNPQNDLGLSIQDGMVVQTFIQHG